MAESRKRILLVEHHDAVAPTARQALDELGVGDRLVCCGTAPEAVAYLKTPSTDRPCVILLSVETPSGADFAVLKSIREDDRLRGIPVVVLASSGDACVASESFELGAAGYMIKSTDHRRFTGAIRRICEYWSLGELPDRAGGSPSAGR
jgi:DNA-binding NarL/FixJ family response regulator